MQMIPNTSSFVKGQNMDGCERWAAQKRRAVAMAQRMYIHSELRARAERMEHCGDIAAAKYCPKCGIVHYISAGMCRDRLCPLCQWRLSKKRYSEMLRCFDLLSDEMQALGVQASMLTLTLKNCDSAHLAYTLKKITDAWHECSRRVAIKQLYGWARSVEITYNRETKTYHPHLHVLLLWDETQEAKAAEAAVLTAKEWRKQLKLSYRPIWDYREAYCKHVDSDTETTSTCFDIKQQYDKAAIAAAKECSKYIIKLDDIAHCPDCDLPTVSAAIKGVRFVGYGGRLKAARAILGLHDTDSVADTEDEHQQHCRDCGNDLKTAILVWAGGGYAYAE